MKIGTSCGKCPKILYTRISDKMAYANSADPDQTFRSSLIKVYTVCHSTLKHSEKQMHKIQNLSKKKKKKKKKDTDVLKKAIKIIGHLP